MDVRRVGAVLVFALAAPACSGRASRAVEDARHPVARAPSGDAAGASGPGAREQKAAAGDISVRVVWVDVPVAARTSPGKTACGTPRAPQVEPTTTWGIPEVLVTVDGLPDGLDATAGEARVRYADCAATPKLVTGSSLLVESAEDRPVRLVLREQDGASARPIQLPIAGHAVTAPLTPDAVFELGLAQGVGDSAWIVAAPGAITDSHGVAMFRDVPAGTYTIRAWLPARGGQPARETSGQVTVGAGELAELTLEL